MEEFNATAVYTADAAAFQGYTKSVVDTKTAFRQLTTISVPAANATVDRRRLRGVPGAPPEPGGGGVW